MKVKFYRYSVIDLQALETFIQGKIDEIKSAGGTVQGMQFTPDTSSVGQDDEVLIMITYI